MSQSGMPPFGQPPGGGGGQYQYPPGYPPAAGGPPPGGGIPPAGMPPGAPPYGNAPYRAPGPGPLPPQGLQERSIGLWIVLSIVTCGICNMIWFFFLLPSDIRKVRGDDKPSGLIDLILSILTCSIWMFYTCYKYPTLLNEGLRQRGFREQGDQPTICLVIAVFGQIWVVPAIIQDTLNKLARGQLSPA